MQEDIHLRVIRGDSAPAAPDGVPGPLRLLDAIEGRCGRREFWPEATQRELASMVGATERSVREWLLVLRSAGVAVWSTGGGGKPSTCYLLQSGETAREAVRSTLAGRPVWRPAGPSGLVADSSGLSSGQHNADSRESSGLAATLPVSLPVGRPSTMSSSSSSSPLPVEDSLPEEDQAESGRTDRDHRLFPGPDSGLTLAGRLAKIGVAATSRLLDALHVVPEEVREATLWRAFHHRATTPAYVFKVLDSVQMLHVAGAIRLPAPAPEPTHATAEDVDEPELAVDADWWAAEGDALTDAFEAALGWEA